MLPSTIENFAEDHTPSCIALHNHPQLSRALDVLIQKNQHHVLFVSQENPIVHREFARACQTQLRNDETPYALNGADVYYFNTEHLETTNIATHLYSTTRYDKKNILVIHVTDVLPESFNTVLKEYLTHPTWRFIFFVSPNLAATFALPMPRFTQFTFTSLQYNDILQVLKSQQKLLEDFHHTLIPENILSAALALATRYIAGNTLLDKTLSLLESAAGHVNTTDQPLKSKPTLTPHWLMQTVSQWTHIPLSHLQANRFSIQQLMESFQENIVGQEEAIEHIATTLNNACFRINDRNQPFCQFLFVGDENNCQRNLSETLSEYFFSDQHALLRLYPDQASHPSLDSIRVIQHSTTTAMPLLDAIKQIPYAVILLESIESVRPDVFALFKTILTDGFAIDQQGKTIDFRHTIICMTTTLAAPQIKQMNQESALQQSQDLLQLIPRANTKPSLSNFESIASEVTATLAQHLPAWLLRHTEVIPLLPPSTANMEEMVARKIDVLKQQLKNQSNIVIEIAEEVIHFLAHKMITKPFANTVDAIFEQLLHPRITQQILAHPSATQLSVRLNETGKFLLCEATRNEKLHALNE